MKSSTIGPISPNALMVAAIALVIGAAACVPPSAASDGVWSGGGPKAKSVFALAIDTATPNIMYAGAMGTGVFKTTDGGATWDPSTTGLTNTYVRSVAIYPLDHAVVFAGTNDGLFVSSDAGITWTLSLATPTAVRTIAFDRSTPSQMYLGCLGTGIFRSTDRGATWQAANSGLSDRNVRTIVSHPIAHNAALAGSGTAGGVCTTSTGGLFWGLVADPDGRGAVYDIEYDPLDASRVYAGFFDRGVMRSTDGGVNWAAINAGLTSFRCRAMALADTLRWVGTDSAGVFYSSAHTNWTPRNFGLASTLIRSMANMPAHPRTALAGTDGAGLFKTTDAGLNWFPLNNDLTDVTGRALMVRNDAARTVVCGTGFGDGIWTSADDAATWIRATTLDTRNSVLDLAQDPAATVIYASIYGSGVYKSVDGGATWSPTDTLSLGNRFVRSLSTNSTNPLEILVGTGNGTYQTTNGGLSWHAQNSGFPSAASVRALVRDPFNPLVVYAGTDSAGVYKTTNGGASWVVANNGLTQIFVHALDINPTGTRILCGTEAGLFRSTNGGALWTPVGSGLPSLPSIRALVSDSPNSSQVFAAVWEGGVYRSSNDGGTWTSMNYGLPDLKTYSLAVNAVDKILYVGTRLRGVFAFTFNIAGAPAAQDPGAHLTLLQAWPNPIVGHTRIRFQVPAAGAVSVRLFDTQGIQVRTLGSGTMAAGTHQLEWDGRDDQGRLLPGGIYWTRVQGVGVSQALKVTLVR